MHDFIFKLLMLSVAFSRLIWGGVGGRTRLTARECGTFDAAAFAAALRGVGKAKKISTFLLLCEEFSNWTKLWFIKCQNCVSAFLHLQLLFFFFAGIKTSCSGLKMLRTEVLRNTTQEDFWWNEKKSNLGESPRKSWEKDFLNKKTEEFRLGREMPPKWKRWRFLWTFWSLHSFHLGVRKINLIRSNLFTSSCAICVSSLISRMLTMSEKNAIKCQIISSSDAESEVYRH